MNAFEKFQITLKTSNLGRAREIKLNIHDANNLSIYINNLQNQIIQKQEEIIQLQADIINLKEAPAKVIVDIDGGRY